MHMNAEQAVREHALGPEHLAGAMALSRAANWNQNEADWRLMLRLGQGFGLSAPDQTLLASTVVLPYETEFAWISMVLVLPEHRRKGYASRLLRRALAHLQDRRLTALLDATAAGHTVYVQEGFADCWGFQRYALSAKPAATRPQEPPDSRIRRLKDSDWPRLLALDAPAFGASREALLRALAQRLPEAALVAERGGELCGYLLGRDGREARQLGPLVAADAQLAQALLTRALRDTAAPLYLDILDRQTGLRDWAQQQGFAMQRPFTRMVRGAARAPGDPATVMLVAGPELG